MKNSRLIQLDILRGIAILLVLGRHPVLAPEQSGSLHAVATAWHRFGWTGVDLFFVLSGFLVGGLIFQELRARGVLDVGRFLIRRGFKIWPSYYLFLAVFAALRLLTDGRGADSWDLLPNLLNIQNYFGSPRVHTWSLAVEEHFYLVLPLVLVALIGRRSDARGKSPPFPRSRSCRSAWWSPARRIRWQVAMGPGYSHDQLLFPTHLRIDALFFGVLIAYVYHFHESVIGRLAGHRSLLAATGLALVAPMAVVPVENSVFVGSLGFAMLYVGYGCLLVAIVTTPLGPRLGRGVDAERAGEGARVRRDVQLSHLPLAHRGRNCLESAAGQVGRTRTRGYRVALGHRDVGVPRAVAGLGCGDGPPCRTSGAGNAGSPLSRAHRSASGSAPAHFQSSRAVRWYWGCSRDRSLCVNHSRSARINSARCGSRVSLARETPYEIFPCTIRATPLCFSSPALIGGMSTLRDERHHGNSAPFISECDTAVRSGIAGAMSHERDFPGQHVSIATW